VKYHAAANLIDNTSDGVKAFTGMITEIIAGDPAVLLIDEPEAFLHPALAFQLGKEISRLSSGTHKNLFVSTHSAHFVMGCIQSGAPVNIVRLTYRSGAATARVLRNDEILRLMRNPLLRSTGVLNGLFYECVVVTEGDTDRAFYQEINERMLNSLAGGIPNCLFLNAQNKQTVQTLIRPLRDLGIPAAAIVDIDILKEGGAVWSGFLEGGFVPPIERQTLATARSAVKQRFDAKQGDMKKWNGGVDLLDPDDKEACSNLIERLSEYGLFVVPRGEVESWLTALGAKGHGPDWLVDIFEKMGEDPASTGYVKPTASDVWGFVSGLRRWLTNPNRKGIPY
jgi:hypothetical protein